MFSFWLVSFSCSLITQKLETSLFNFPHHHLQSKIYYKSNLLASLCHSILPLNIWTFGASLYSCFTIKKLWNGIKLLWSFCYFVILLFCHYYSPVVSNFFSCSKQKLLKQTFSFKKKMTFIRIGPSVIRKIKSVEIQCVCYWSLFLFQTNWLNQNSLSFHSIGHLVFCFLFCFLSKKLNICLNVYMLI